MKTIKTVKCKLQVDNKQAKTLQETLQSLANACKRFLVSLRRKALLTK
jgi:hypothetical protein